MEMEIDVDGVPDQIYSRLRERILKGQLESGEQIVIDSVAREFGVSIIPVREAMRMLEADRLIEILPRRSPIVSGLSPREVLEIGTIRLALEPVALAAAIPNLTDEDLQASRIVLAEFGSSTDPWEQVELNRKFHLALYEPSQMKRLLSIVSAQYIGMTRCAQFLVIRSSREIGKSVSEHEAILDACVKRDVDEAVQTLRSHLEASATRLRTELGIV